MIRSIRLRLILIGGLLLLGFVLLSGIAINTALERYTHQAESQRLQGIVYGLLAAVDVDDSGNVLIDSASLPESRMNQSDSGLFAYITQDDATPSWRSISSPEDITQPTAAVDIGEWYFLAEPSPSLSFGFEWLGHGTPSYRFTLTVEDRNSPLYEHQSLFKERLKWGLVFVALILLLTLLGLMYWGLKPLKSVVDQLQAIRQGQREHIEHEAPTEIQPLTDSINTLLSQERHRQERYRHAMDDLAHSLKTPLALLKSHPSASHPDQTTAIDRIDQIVSYQLQKAALPAATALHAPINLKNGLERTIHALEKVYADKKLTFNATALSTQRYPIEEGDWMELCGNLLDNAARHAVREVRVHLKDTDAGLKLTIQDDGTGLPANPETLLQRGVRADSLAPGQGIGLAVVADICASYGFDLTLSNAASGGAKLSLDIPT